MGVCASTIPGVMFPDGPTGRPLTASQLECLSSSKGCGVIHQFSNPPTDEYALARSKGLDYDHHDAFPSAVAQPVTKEEVAAVLKLCVDNGIDVSVKAGGHGTLSMKGSVVIDLGALNEVTVDAESEPPMVTISGGCLNRDVDAATKPYGVAVTQGNAGSVGTIGAMMGGGVGFLARWQGLTIDLLQSATVVLASGEIVEATPDNEHSELLFAIKGGGGNFGIVVSAKVKASRIGWDSDPARPGYLFSGVRVVRHDNGPMTMFANGLGECGVFQAWRDYALQAPDCLSMDCVLPCGGPMIQQYTYKGPYEEARAESQAWDSLGRAAITDLKPQSYHTDLQGELEKILAKDTPLAHTFKVAIMGSMPDEVVAALMYASNAGRPNDMSLIHVERLGGKIDAPDDGEDAAAFSHRGGLFWISMIGVYSKRGGAVTPEMTAKVEAWHEELLAKLEPYTVRTEEDPAGILSPRKVGTITPWTSDGGAHNVFGEEGAKVSTRATKKVARILAAKKKYDPTNVFNHVENGFSNATNIDPATGIAHTPLDITNPIGGEAPATPVKGGA